MLDARYGHACGERIVKAGVLEGQLVDWIRGFQPDGALLDLLLDRLRAASGAEQHESAGERRSELLGQLKRLQDLYVLGDLTKTQYTMRRQAIEEQVQRLGPPTEPALDRARAVLEDLPRFWEIETQPAERRKLLLRLFEHVYAGDGRIVAVQPHDDFLPYFRAAATEQAREPSGTDEWCRKRERRGSAPYLSPRLLARALGPPPRRETR